MVVGLKSFIRLEAKYSVFVLGTQLEARCGTIAIERRLWRPLGEFQSEHLRAGHRCLRQRCARSARACSFLAFSFCTSARTASGNSTLSRGASAFGNSPLGERSQVTVHLRSELRLIRELVIQHLPRLFGENKGVRTEWHCRDCKLLHVQCLRNSARSTSRGFCISG